MEFRDLGRQYRHLQPELAAAVEQVMKSGCYIGGPVVQQLEHSLADAVDMPYCISCANGTDALVLLLKANGIGPGDVVLVPSFTFIATAEAVSLAGATPWFIDVQFPTGNLCPESLEQALRHQPWKAFGSARAVLAVDLFGLPADYDIIEKISLHYGLILLEDSAQSLGASLQGRPCGSFGAGAATSFFPAKPLGCYGDGGAVFVRDSSQAEQIRSLAHHGAGKTKYENVRFGQNSRLDAVQAAVLLVKLSHLEEEQRAVDKIAAYYSNRLERYVTVPKAEAGKKSAWAQYTIVLPREGQQTPIQQFLREQGVPSGIYYPLPLHLQKAYRFLGGAAGDCPQAEQLCRRVLSLPMGPYLTEEEAEHICDSIVYFLQTL